jgi:serine/threonine-protein phosphatase PP1 catalytic subunit
LKIVYPDHLFLLRGNHETPELTAQFGFMHECQRKLNFGCWQSFCKVFEAIPIAAVVGGSYFCVHGGLSPELRGLKQIEAIRRPLKVPPAGLVTDLLWSDPDDKVTQFGPNNRGPTITWGMGAARTFMARNKIRKIIRAHQVVMNGFCFPFSPNESVVTLFTASNYALGCQNKAAILMIGEDLSCRYRVLPTGMQSMISKARPKSVYSDRIRISGYASVPSIRCAPLTRPATRVARRANNDPWSIIGGLM